MYESMLNFPGSVFGHFDRLSRELDDIFSIGAPTSIRSVAAGAFPALNIGNTPSSVEIYAFAPGVDADKFEITLDRGVLTLSGERAPVAPESDKQRTYSRERVSGRFTRAVSLPDDIDPTQVKATYRDGVLQISVARHEAAQPRRISVQ